MGYVFVWPVLMSFAFTISIASVKQHQVTGQKFKDHLRNHYAGAGSLPMESLYHGVAKAVLFQRL